MYTCGSTYISKAIQYTTQVLLIYLCNIFSNEEVTVKEIQSSPSYVHLQSEKVDWNLGGCKLLLHISNAKKSSQRETNGKARGQGDQLSL
jgi:hypothetical protein